MQARRVGFTHGWLWIRQALNLIVRNPVLSVVFAAIVGASLLLVMMIPLFGPLLGLLLFPAIVAGYMRACLAMEMHEDARIAHLLAGFKVQSSRLIALGGILMIGVFSIIATIVALGGDPLLQFLKKAQEITDPDAMRAAMEAAGEGVTSAFFTGTLLLLALLICLQFAPMRVLFDHETPLAAIKSSVVATFRNILPYIAYSLLLYVIVLVISHLPLLIALVLNLTLSMTSLYAAYRDIFAAQQSASAPVAQTATRDEQSHF